MSGKLVRYSLIVALAFTGLIAHAKIIRQFEHLSIEQGLSLSVVHAIAQDKAGYMWFGTQDGLNRYDGYSFDVLRTHPGEPNALPDNFINSLLADDAGGLWIGTTRGLAYRDGQTGIITTVKFDGIEPGAAPFVSSLQLNGQQLWIGSNAGLFVLQLGQFEAKGVGVVERQRSAVEGRQIHSLLLTTPSALWVGTSRGLKLYNAQENSWRNIDATSGYNIRQIFADSDDSFLLGTDSGLLRYERARDRVTHIASDASRCGAQQALSNQIQAIARDKNGQIWIGTPYGAVVLGESGSCDWYQQDFNQAGALSRSDVLTLYPDRDGVLWLGTFAGGVNKWNSRAGSWQHHLVASDANSSPVLAVLRDRAGTLWLGTSDKGLLRQRQGETTVSSVTLQLPHTQTTIESINALWEDSNGDLWIGTQGYGLLRRDSQGRLHSFSSSEKNEKSISGDFVTCIYEDREGLLWVSSEAGIDRIDILDRSNVKFTRFGKKLPDAFAQIDNEILSIVEDWQGQLWLAGPAGLLRFDKKDQFLYFPLGTDEKSPAASTIQALAFTPDGELWIASAEGVSRLRGRQTNEFTFERFYQQGQVTSIGVYSITPGRDGELWLGSNAGMLRFDPNKRETLQIRTEQGLLSNEFNPRAAFVAQDGELIFGHITGALSFNPRAVALPTVPNMVHLVSWHIFDKVQPLPMAQQAINVDSDDRVLSFDFSLLEFTAPTLHRLRYRLHGLHESWVVLEGSRTVVLTGLPAGDYRLEVQLANAAGMWSAKNFELPIRVNSPFWSIERRYWTAIVVLVLLSLAAIATLVFRLRRAQRLVVVSEGKWHDQRLNLEKRLREIIAERHELESVIGDREREILDLSTQLDHQNKVDSLTGLPNRFALMSQLRAWQDEGNAHRYTMMLIDIDGLRFINERHGHHAGDQILVQAGNMLHRNCRGNDQVYRLYADVFVLVSAIRHDNEPALLAERIRSSFLQKPFSLAHRRRADLTCSVGFANWPIRDNDSELMKPEQVLVLADRALELAKRNSRNAWVGFYASDALDENDVRGGWAQKLPELIEHNKLTYRTSIALALDIEWYDTRTESI